MAKWFGTILWKRVIMVMHRLIDGVQELCVAQTLNPRPYLNEAADKAFAAPYKGTYLLWVVYNKLKEPGRRTSLPHWMVRLGFQFSITILIRYPQKAIKYPFSNRVVLHLALPFLNISVPQKAFQ